MSTASAIGLRGGGGSSGLLCNDESSPLTSTTSPPIMNRLHCTRRTMVTKGIPPSQIFPWIMVSTPHHVSYVRSKLLPASCLEPRKGVEKFRGRWVGGEKFPLAPLSHPTWGGGGVVGTRTPPSRKVTAPSRIIPRAPAPRVCRALSPPSASSPPVRLLRFDPPRPHRGVLGSNIFPEKSNNFWGGIASGFPDFLSDAFPGVLIDFFSETRGKTLELCHGGRGVLNRIPCGLNRSSGEGSCTPLFQKESGIFVFEFHFPHFLVYSDPHTGSG